MTTQLAERYRPSEWANVVGQPRAVQLLRGICAKGIGGRALVLVGPTGVGKTTCARIAARTIADDDFITEHDGGDDFGVAALEAWRSTVEQWGGWIGSSKAGRVLIVNEIHRISARVQASMLGMLERIPAHAAVILTTTWDGQESMFDGIDAKPLWDRCVRVDFTNQGAAGPFAERLAEVARAEGVELDAARALKLVREGRNSMRAALERLDRIILAEAGALA